MQIIRLLCQKIKETSSFIGSNNSLTVTGEAPDPFTMREGIRSNDIHMPTTHEEADVIMVQQLFTEITTKKLEKDQIICDDTDVFVLLLYFYWKLQIEADVLMEATSGNRNIIDIKQSVCKNKDLDSDFNLVQNECTLLVSSCYGFPSESMTACRIKTWYSKTAKARTKAPELKSLPHTDESFVENIKSCHYQCAIWYSTMDPHPPDQNPCDFGWLKNEGIDAAPVELLKTIRCSCASEKPCSTRRYGCVSSRIACSLVCACGGDIELCGNEETKAVQNDSEDEEDVQICICIFLFCLRYMKID